MNSIIRFEKPELSLSQLVDEFFNETPWFGTNRSLQGLSYPVVDIVEHDENYTITAEIPGVKKENIRLNIENDVLTISGEKKVEHKDVKKEQYYYYERSFGSFERSFGLPKHVDVNSIEASYKEGILQIVLKKTPEAKPKAIEVKVD